MGVFFPAVLLANWQLGWWRLQKNVSVSQSLRGCFLYPVLTNEKTHHLNAMSPSTFRLFSALSALFVSALIISVIFAIIPLCNNVLVLAIAMAVSGLAMGVIDTIANIQLVTIYQKDSAVFLQVKQKNHAEAKFFIFLNKPESRAFVCGIFAGSSLLHWVRSLGEPADC